MYSFPEIARPPSQFQHSCVCDSAYLEEFLPDLLPGSLVGALYRSRPVKPPLDKNDPVTKKAGRLIQTWRGCKDVTLRGSRVPSWRA